MLQFAQQMEMETGATAGDERVNADKEDSNNLVTCTPTTGTNTNTVPVVQKTPLSVVNSALNTWISGSGHLFNNSWTYGHKRYEAKGSQSMVLLMLTGNVLSGKTKVDST